jgi:hypothetical protein
MTKSLTAAATAIAAFLILASAGKADVVVCNDIGAPIHVAFAYQARDGFAAFGTSKRTTSATFALKAAE